MNHQGDLADTVRALSHGPFRLHRQPLARNVVPSTKSADEIPHTTRYGTNEQLDRTHPGTLPALFDRSLFPELHALRGDTGAKGVIQRHLASVVSVPFPAGELDVDTGEDAGRLARGPEGP